nr:hypothetical protein [Tanacetum cinerariifolium]
MEAQSFKDLIVQNMNFIEQCIVERSLHEQEIQKRLKRLNYRKLQIQECKVQEDEQNANDNEDEHVVLANLIANLKLDINENKNIQKQLRKANASLTHELNECKSALVKSNDIRDRCRSALHHQEIELEKYKTYKNYTIEKEEV